MQRHRNVHNIPISTKTVIFRLLRKTRSTWLTRNEVHWKQHFEPRIWYSGTYKNFNSFEIFTSTTFAQGSKLKYLLQRPKSYSPKDVTRVITSNGQIEPYHTTGGRGSWRHFCTHHVLYQYSWFLQILMLFVAQKGLPTKWRLNSLCVYSTQIITSPLR